MPLHKEEMKVMLIEYICDDCGKGVLRFMNRTKPGIMKGSTMFTHICTNCKKITEVSNIKYPYQSMEAVTKDGKLSEIFKNIMKKEDNVSG